jgi:hypothetical protein
MPGFDGTGPAGQGPMTGGGRGRGRGRGGQRQGMGPAKECRCPKCGFTQPHVPGNPCANQTCPKCGTGMIGI